MPLESIRDGLFRCNETEQDNSVDWVRNFSQYYDDRPLILSLSARDLQILREDSVVCDRLGRRPHPEKIEDWSVLPKIQAYLREHFDTGVFVKVCDASPKDVLQGPLRTAKDIWMALAQSKRVRTFLLANDPLLSDLVIRPWIREIGKHNEFRVFIRNSRLVAISQQCWYKRARVQDPERVGDAVEEWMVEKKVELPNGSGVLNMFIDSDGIAHLIEVNPWSRSSGSALFRWDELERFTGDPVKIRLVK